MPPLLAVSLLIRSCLMQLSIQEAAARTVGMVPLAAAASRLNGNARGCEWHTLYCTKTATVMGTGVTRYRRRECNGVTLARQTLHSGTSTKATPLARLLRSAGASALLGRSRAAGLREQCNSTRFERCHRHSRCSCPGSGSDVYALPVDTFQEDCPPVSNSIVMP